VTIDVGKVKGESSTTPTLGIEREIGYRVSERIEFREQENEFGIKGRAITQGEERLKSQNPLKELRSSRISEESCRVTTRESLNCPREKRHRRSVKTIFMVCENKTREGENAQRRGFLLQETVSRISNVRRQGGVGVGVQKRKRRPLSQVFRK